MQARRKPKTVTIPRSRALLRSPTFRYSFWIRLLPAGLLLLVLCLEPATAIPGGASPRDKSGEKPYALIYGTVWGPDDHPLYGVKVKIRRADQKKARWELYSDHSGEFAQRVPVGPADYVVWVDLKGYKYSVPLRLEQDVKVHIDSDERQDIGVHLKQ
jgi:hypothetical protein